MQPGNAVTPLGVPMAVPNYFGNLVGQPGVASGYEAPGMIYG